MKLNKLIALAGILTVFGCHKAFAFNPVTDIQENLKWTVGEQAIIGTAYKVGGGGPINIGQRGDSAFFGIFDYRFIKESYGAISDPQNGGKFGDGLKTGLMLNYFFGWFKSPQTPAMLFLNNVNIGPSVTFPLLTDSKSLQHPSVWMEASYQFGK